jgi:tRNA pseudouridine synthase 10
MLGNGRPFVVELKKPRRRTIDLREAERRINEAAEGVEVSALEPADAKEVIRIKSARPEKSYRVSVVFQEGVTQARVEGAAGQLKGAHIHQRTPRRVAHRRADRTRRRKIQQIAVERWEPTGAVMVVTAEAGTYIKEFVTGDGGRTQPSLSDALGVPCRVDALDVIAVGGIPGDAGTEDTSPGEHSRKAG